MAFSKEWEAVRNPLPHCFVVKTTSKGTISTIALVFFLAFPACPAVANAELPKLTTSEKMAWSTYAIATEKGLGTGVIVNREDPSAPGGIVPVLVTCTHVFFFFSSRRRHTRFDCDWSSDVCSSD